MESLNQDSRVTFQRRRLENFSGLFLDRCGYISLLAIVDFFLRIWVGQVKNRKSDWWMSFKEYIYTHCGYMLESIVRLILIQVGGGKIAQNFKLKFEIASLIFLKEDVKCSYGWRFFSNPFWIHSERKIFVCSSFRRKLIVKSKSISLESILSWLVFL